MKRISRKLSIPNLQSPLNFILTFPFPLTPPPKLGRQDIHQLPQRYDVLGGGHLLLRLQAVHPLRLPELIHVGPSPFPSPLPLPSQDFTHHFLSFPLLMIGELLLILFDGSDTLVGVFRLFRTAVRRGTARYVGMRRCGPGP